MTHPKKLLIIISIIMTAISGFSQNQTIGIGLFGLFNRNLNFTYEKEVVSSFSCKIGTGILIPGKLPHHNLVISALSEEETEGYFEQAIEELKFSAFSITPEIHYYFRKKSLTGFYIGPYIRYARYMFNSSYNSDIDYTDEQGNAQTEENVVFDLTGRIQKIGAGINLGYQHIIADKYFIDFGIVGPGLFYINATSNVVSPDFPSEESITEFVDNELEVIPEIFGDIKVNAVNDKEAKGIWNRFLPTYRCNISIGFVF